MTDFLEHVARLAGRDAVCVTVVDVAGSAPREPGAGMFVCTPHVFGTIGGGRDAVLKIERF